MRLLSVFAVVAVALPLACSSSDSSPAAPPGVDGGPLDTSDGAVPPAGDAGPASDAALGADATLDAGPAPVATPIGGGWNAYDGPGADLYGVAFGGGRFVVVGDSRTILTSDDGVRFAAASPPDTDYERAFAVAHDGTRFVMVGSMKASSCSAVPPLIATSPDGVAWTRRTWAGTGVCRDLTAVAATPTRMTAVGTTGSIVTSTDGGGTWNVDTNPAGIVSTLYGVADNGTVRVAVGTTNVGYLILTDSGSGWVNRTDAAFTGFVPSSVTWTGAAFVATCGFCTGTIVKNMLQSTDGVTWTAVDGTPPMYAIGKIGTTFYGVSDDVVAATHPRSVLTAPDLATWTSAGTWNDDFVTNPGTLHAIAGSSSRVVVIGRGKTIVSKP